MKKVNLLLVAAVLISAQAFGQKVNVEKSTIKWTGSKVGGSHTGEIKLKSGELEVKADKIVKGNFVVDMTSITNTDIQDKESSQKLVGHLKSDDFFGVTKYPTSTLTVKKSTKFENNKATVTGDLTIKGKTEEVTFVVTKGNGTYNTTLEVDRSKFDVRYGSKTFFDNLGDKVIDNIFVLEINIVTQ